MSSIEEVEAAARQFNDYELIGGAIFTLLYDGVKKALVETSTFKCLLKDLKFTLESLTRLRATAIQQIGVYNVELGLPNEEIEDLERRMEEGAKLVEKLSNSSLWKWNYCSISFYSDQIVDLDRALRRLLENLKLQEARDVKELLELSRKAERNTHKDLNEVKRMLLNIEKLLQQKEEGVMETSASGRNTETMTEPNEGNGGEQGTSENDNRNRVSNTSSSTEISQVLEAASTRMDESQTDGEILEKTNLRVFSFAELKVTTRNFRPDAVLGEGGFGKVFKGWVDKKTFAPSKPGNGMAVAIKRLDTNSLQGIREWQSEVNFLGELSHSNIVKLLGYCWEKKELLLVYELMPRGSLENHLFRRSAAIKTLSWDKRLKIAVGAAQGLAFLHTLEVPVILRDFKSSNILLDGKYNAKICDFGLAKLGPTGGDSHVSTVIAGTEFIATGLAKLGPTDGKSHVSTRVMGTYGYAAPEYVATGCLYVKSDVYGFGVVLLEILTGLRVIDTKRPSKKINLVDWVKPLLLHKRKLKTIMDERIEGKYSFEAALQTAHLTLKCLQPDPRNRPSMEEVLDALEQIQAIKGRPEAIQTCF